MFIALDPGLATFGWAVVDDNGAVHDVGVIMSASNAKKLGKHRGRRERLRAQARDLIAIVRRWRDHGVTIVAEEMSFKRGRIAQIVSMSLSWGSIVAIAECHGATTRAIPPKTWQGAIAPAATAGGELDYDKVFAELERYVREQCREKLLAIASSKRNHALDAVGVGVYAAMTPESTAVPRATRKRRRTA